MAFRYKTSPTLLSEIWRALRLPVTPAKSALAQRAIRACFEHARQSGPEQSSTCCAHILYHAAGGTRFTPEAQEELTAILLGGAGSLSGSAGSNLPRIADFCLKLEMLGFDLDSGPICERRPARPPRKTGGVPAPRASGAMGSDGRFNQCVTIGAGECRRHKQIRTLRTHKGFILQAYLGRGLDPIRLDVFGPHYNDVSDWMDLLSADKAWSLELRDVPGYDPSGRKHSPARPAPHFSRISAPVASIEAAFRSSWPTFS